MSKRLKSQRVKLIVNPHAGNPDEANTRLKLATESLKKNGFKVDLALARPKEEATPIARRAVKDGYKIVIAMGGDGTIEAVIRGVVGSKIRLGIIPAGTANNVARSLGIPQDLEEACALIASEHTLKLDVGQLKTSQGKKFVFFEIATMGLSAAIFPAMNKVSDGKLSQLKDAALTIIHQETRPKVYLTMNDESKVEVETMLVVVSNTPLFGKNFLVAPGASLQDGLLDISVYPDFSKAELLRYFASVMDGGFSGDKKVQHYQVRKLKIKASPKMEVMADGVVLDKGTVTVKSRPGALRVITALEIPGPEEIRTEVAQPAEAVSVPPAEKNTNTEEYVISLG